MPQESGLQLPHRHTFKIHSKIQLWSLIEIHWEYKHLHFLQQVFAGGTFSSCRTIRNFCQKVPQCHNAVKSEKSIQSGCFPTRSKCFTIFKFYSAAIYTVKYNCKIPLVVAAILCWFLIRLMLDNGKSIVWQYQWVGFNFNDNNTHFY